MLSTAIGIVVLIAMVVGNVLRLVLFIRRLAETDIGALQNAWTQPANTEIPMLELPHDTLLS